MPDEKRRYRRYGIASGQKCGSPNEIDRQEGECYAGLLTPGRGGLQRFPRKMALNIRGRRATESEIKNLQGGYQAQPITVEPERKW